MTVIIILIVLIVLWRVLGKKIVKNIKAKKEGGEQ